MRRWGEDVGDEATLDLQKRTLSDSTVTRGPLLPFVKSPIDDTRWNEGGGEVKVMRWDDAMMMMTWLRITEMSTMMMKMDSGCPGCPQEWRWWWSVRITEISHVLAAMMEMARAGWVAKTPPHWEWPSAFLKCERRRMFMMMMMKELPLPRCWGLIQTLLLRVVLDSNIFHISEAGNWNW